MKKIISITLALLMLVPCLVACKKDKTDGGDTQTLATPDQIGVNISDKIAGVNLGGERIDIWQFTTPSNSAEYFYDQNGQIGGADLVSEEIYKRNASAKELLNCEIVFTDTKTASGDSGEYIRRLVSAGDDSYDAFQIIQWNGMPLAVEGLFMDLSNAKYIDYSQAWWSEAYTEATEVRGKRYVLAGDVSIDMISCASAMFVNKKMLSEYHGSNAYTDIYNLVKDRKWTWEKMKEYCTGIYDDLNSDLSPDINDQFAFLSNNSNRIDSWFFGFGGTVFGRAADESYTLDFENEMNLNRMDLIADIMYKRNDNEYGSKAGSTVINGALTDAIVKKFVAGDTLFHGGFLYTARNFGSMTDAFGVVPYPKYDENQKDYKSVMHNIVNLYAIPITNSAGFDSTCAVFEALSAIGHSTLVPTYYETVLKLRYADANEDAQMIDIIYNSRMTDAGYVFENRAAEIPRFMIIWENSFSHFVEKYRNEMTSQLNDLNNGTLGDATSDG